MSRLRFFFTLIFVFFGIPAAVACEAASEPNRTGQSHWYCASQASTVIVFVHGLNANSADTWRHIGDDGREVVWPDLALRDPAIAENGPPSVLLASFHTSPGSKNFSIADAQKQIFDAMFASIDGHPPAIDKSTIILVGHSLGGVLLRDLLSQYPDRFQGKRLGLLLVASPSKGSSFANLAQSAQWAVGANAQVAELEQGSTYLTQVHERFNAVIGETGPLRGLIGRELYEHLGILEASARCESNTLSIATVRCAMLQTAVSYIDQGPVVTADSAVVYWPEKRRLVPQSDHFSIAKPADTGHSTHQALRELVAATRNVKGCMPPDNFGVTFTIKQQDRKCRAPAAEALAASFELFQLSTNDGLPVRSAMTLTFDPIARAHRLRLSGGPFPCADDMFWGKLTETVTTSRRAGPDLCLTEVCFRRSVRRPTAPFALLDCIFGDTCRIPASSAGIAESCRDQDRTPIMVAVKPDGGQRTGWTAPSLQTIEDLPPQQRPGYTEFHLVSEPLQKLKGVTTFGISVSVNGNAVHFDGVPDFFYRVPVSEGERVHLTFPIENLGFRGGDNGDGYEDIEVNIRFFKHDQILATAALQRRYVAYRHAHTISETDLETGEIFSWRAIYRPAGTGHNFEVMLEHGSAPQRMKDRRQGVDALSFTYDAQPVIGVLRPGRTENRRIGMILGLVQPTGQVQSLFTRQEAEALCRWVRQQTGFDELQKDFSYIFEFPVETFDDTRDRGRSVADCSAV